MAHKPRAPSQWAPSKGRPPEFKFPDPVKRAKKKPSHMKPGMERISLKNHEVDSSDVFEQLFGTKPNFDVITGVVKPYGPTARGTGSPPMPQ